MAETNQTNQISRKYAEEIDRLLNELNKEETDFKKIAEIVHKCLKAMSLNNVCEYMIRKKAPMTKENIEKILLVAQKAYFLGCSCNGQN